MKKTLSILAGIASVFMFLGFVDAVAAAPYPPALGGTGTSIVPASGTVPIGNGAGTYTPALITPGTDIIITNASGSVTIAVKNSDFLPSSTVYVASVNGQSGAVTITSSTLGVATNTLSLFNGAGFTTTTIQAVLNALSATGLATYNSSTGVFSVSSSSLNLGSASQYRFSDFLPSSTVYVASVNGQSGAVTISVPATTTINGVQATVFKLIGDGTTVTSTVNGTTTTFSVINTGNWAGTWQGVNSSTFYLASNPTGFATTTIQSVLNALSAAGLATYNSSTGVFTVSSSSLNLGTASTRAISDFLASTTTYLANNLGNWAGTWQGTNSSTFYLATNPSAYISTSTGLTTGNFASANISQWTNNSGYITTSTFNATGTAGYFPFWSAGGNSLSPTSSISYVSSTGVTVLSGATNIGGNTNVTGTLSTTNGVTIPIGTSYFYGFQGSSGSQGLAACDGSTLCFYDQGSRVLDFYGTAARFYENQALSNTSAITWNTSCAGCGGGTAFAQLQRVASGTLQLSGQNSPYQAGSHYYGQLVLGGLSVGSASSANPIDDAGTADFLGGVAVGTTTTNTAQLNIISNTTTTASFVHTGAATTTLIEGSASSSVCDVKYTASSSAVYVTYLSSGQEIVNTNSCQ